MKIYVFSDTHGLPGGMMGVLRRDLPDVLIHCGDGCMDAMEAERTFPGLAVYAVAGNCDEHTRCPREQTFDLAGKKIYICHSDHFGSQDVQMSHEEKILAHAKIIGVDFAFFGHTHTPYFAHKDGVYLMNPGAARAKTNENPSYGVVTIGGAGVDFKILSL